MPPQAFTPPPKVHSAVVHLTALPAPRFPADPKTLEMVVARAFNQRRKMLRAALKGLRPDIEDRLIAAGIAPTDRAEQVDVERFCALARALDVLALGTAPGELAPGERTVCGRNRLADRFPAPSEILRISAYIWITRSKASRTLSCIISDRVGCGKTVFIRSSSVVSSCWPTT